jgi:hypothetical protein
VSFSRDGKEWGLWRKVETDYVNDITNIPAELRKKGKYGECMGYYVYAISDHEEFNESKSYGLCMQVGPRNSELYPVISSTPLTAKFIRITMNEGKNNLLCCKHCPLRVADTVLVYPISDKIHVKGTRFQFYVIMDYKAETLTITDA